MVDFLVGPPSAAAVVRSLERLRLRDFANGKTSGGSITVSMELLLKEGSESLQFAANKIMIHRFRKESVFRELCRLETVFFSCGTESAAHDIIKYQVLCW